MRDDPQLRRLERWISALLKGVLVHAHQNIMREYRERAGGNDQYLYRIDKSVE